MNKILFAVIVLATSVVLLNSCYTQKKAVQQLNRAHNNFPDTTAILTRTWFPCIVTASDTINRTDTLYDFIEVQCPDSIYYRVDSFETIEAVRVPVYVKVKQPRIIETREVTIRIKDSATVFICHQDLAKETKRADKAEAKAKRRGKINTWLWIIVIGLSLYTFRKPLARALKIPL